LAKFIIQLRPIRPKRWSYWLGFAAVLGICLAADEAPTQELASIQVAVAFSDVSAPEKQWDHLRSFQDSVLLNIRTVVLAGFEHIARCKAIPKTVVIDGRGRSNFTNVGDADYAVHFIVRKLDKLFRNRTTYGSNNRVRYSVEESRSREIVALPALSVSLEIRLIQLERNKVIWSTLQDSTVLVPHGNRFVYNAEKYPGVTHPDMIRDYIAPILRQRQRRPAALRMLSVADRWYLSQPEDDIAAAEALTYILVEDIMPEIDARLPLYGSIVSLLGTDGKKRPRCQLDLGAQQGIVKKMRLDIFSQGAPSVKIGQIEIVSVDSSSSTAHLRKLERSARKRGETLAVGDRVFSRQRPPQFAKRNTP
jgi:hypothetical protein